MNTNTPAYQRLLGLGSRRRRRSKHPEMQFLNAMLELALQRVNFVLDFARQWRTLRQAPDYELQRANCQLHLAWIFDDKPTKRFTFREICQFSGSPLLQKVEPARERIRRAFEPAAACDVARPVAAKLQQHVECAWLADPNSLSVVDSEQQTSFNFAVA